MMTRAPVTHERVKALLDYDTVTGELRWTGAAVPRVRGKLISAGTNYVYVQVDGRSHPAHRVIWFWMTGEWPPEQIDHINGDKRDNRFCNLRLATAARGRSGAMGVQPHRNRWQASISVGRKRVNLGTYTTKEEAAAAYLRAAEKQYGAEFVRRSKNT